MGEGAEEAVSTLLTPYLERAIYNADAENATAAEQFVSGRYAAAFLSVPII